MTTLCQTCAHMRQDKDSWHLRCHSPQITKAGLPGTLVAFERDDYPEPDRSHEEGTGKCGPKALNRREA